MCPRNANKVVLLNGQTLIKGRQASNHSLTFRAHFNKSIPRWAEQEVVAEL